MKTLTFGAKDLILGNKEVFSKTKLKKFKTLHKKLQFKILSTWQATTVDVSIAIISLLFGLLIHLFVPQVFQVKLYYNVKQIMWY